MATSNSHAPAVLSNTSRQSCVNDDVATRRSIPITDLNVDVAATTRARMTCANLYISTGPRMDPIWSRYRDVATGRGRALATLQHQSSTNTLGGRTSTDDGRSTCASAVLTARRPTTQIQCATMAAIVA
jgi:hypothetical protein